MTSRERRDRHFRPGFKLYDWPKRNKVNVGWDARRMAKGEGPVGLQEMANRTGLKTAKEIANACRAGRLPMWRFERLTGRVLWHRLEIEAFMFWHRAKKRRSRVCPGQRRNSKTFTDFISL
jgi:hypothetical protein